VTTVNNSVTRELTQGIVGGLLSQRESADVGGKLIVHKEPTRNSCGVRNMLNEIVVDNSLLRCHGVIQICKVGSGVER
jgi:hypothetical protein